MLGRIVEGIGNVHNYFYRVEFQQRGCLHIHALFWVTNAPVYGKNTHSEVASFVEKYVSCSDDVQNIEADLLNLQLHRHAKKMEKTYIQLSHAAYA